MKLNISHKVIILLSLGLIAVSSAKAQDFEFLLMKEGLQSAKIEASNTLDNPVLVFVAAIDSPSEDLLIIYEGPDIGKSNYWMFLFIEEGNDSKYVIFATIKMFGMVFSLNMGNFETIEHLILSNPIDETQLIDSDEFAKSIISNSDFKQPSDGVNAFMGICNFKSSSPSVPPCSSSEEIRWYYYTGIFDEYDYEVFLSCCFAPYFDVSEIECEFYDGISENSTHFTISPNPTDANAIASFGLLESGNITLEICDIFGNIFYTTSNFYDVGEHSVVLETKDIPSGSYICRILLNEKQIGTTNFVVGK